MPPNLKIILRSLLHRRMLTKNRIVIHTVARMKLLVVDDQSPVGEIISRIALQSGWEAIHTVSSDRIDEILRAEKVDVLLIDYAIDGNPHSTKNGLSVVADLRSKGMAIPVIIFSGWPDLIEAKRARELGVLRVLEKPISIQELRQSLADAKKQCLEEVSASPSK
jgi:two-component system OmpR family response regulator